MDWIQRLLQPVCLQTKPCYELPSFWQKVLTKEKLQTKEAFLNHAYCMSGPGYHKSSQHIFTSRVSGRGYRNGPVCVSVCVCVCQCVNTLMPEALNLWSRNLVQGLTLMISRRSSMVTVIGQRSRSQGQKMWLQQFSDFSAWIHNASLMWWHVMVPRRHVTSHDVTWRHMTSRNVTAWCH